MSERSIRVCTFTPRGLLRNAFRCSNYESLDVLCEIDDVDVLTLRPGMLWNARRELHKRAVWHDFTRKAVSLNVAFRPIRLTRDYDLFVAHLPLTQDLVHLPSIKQWKNRCNTSVCWIEELWAADLPRLEPWLSALDAFDHVATSFLSSVEPLSKMLGRACHFVPAGVDTLRFSPLPRQPARTIDILSIGRRSAEIHRAFSHVSKDRDWLYIHDTFNGSYAEIDDHRAHRNLLANMVRRSRFFVVAPAKAGSEEESQGQVEVGLRYYEAAAGGAVMVGQTPRCEAFRTLFDWRDPVVELKPDGSDAADVLLSLSSDAERLAEIGRRNAVEALSRHDWVYRWEQIFQLAGLKSAQPLLARKAKLQELAQIGAGSQREPAKGPAPADVATRIGASPTRAAQVEQSVVAATVGQ